MGKKKSAKLHSADGYAYLDIRMEFEEELESDITRDIFGYIIYSAVKKLHGEVAAASPIDVIEFNQINLQATIQCHAKSLEKVWSSLTLYGIHNGQRCLFHVKEIAPSSRQMSLGDGSDSDGENENMTEETATM